MEGPVAFGTGGHRRAVPAVSRFAATLWGALLMTAAPADEGPVTPARPLIDDPFHVVLDAALAAGQFTVNLPWSAADLDAQGIPRLPNYRAALNYAGMLAWEGTTDFPLRPGAFRPYLTTYEQYRVKREQCRRDNGVNHRASGEPYCYPNLVEAVAPVNSRYGYYCGGGFPPHPAFAQKMPDPLDGVDYCCRLHDKGLWQKKSGLQGADECGIVMCLSKVNASPAGILDSSKFAEVKKARDYWYGWASTACPGDQRSPVPPPALGP
jgi:hypothetical protein